MYQGKIHSVQVFNHGISEKHSDPTKCYLKHWYPVRMAKVRLPSEEALMKLIRLSPRPEWQDLVMMLRDESRSLLKEMSTYFASMIQINMMAQHYMSQNDNDMLALHHTVYGAYEILHPVIEESTGLMKDIEDHAPKSFKDTTKLFAYLLNNGKSNQVAVQRMADAAGLDSVLLGLDGYGEDDNERASSGGSGGLKPHAPEVDTHQPASQDEMDILAEYLNGAFDAQEVSPGISEPTYDNEPPAAAVSNEYVTSSNKPLSSMAAAVEKNLANMPWMASAVEYTQTQSALVQTELFFNDGNTEKAEAAVNEVLDSLAEQLQYPTTSMKDSLLSTDQIKGAIARLIGN
jgi:type I restriction-modification system DNA methylase subunit